MKLLSLFITLSISIPSFAGPAVQDVKYNFDSQKISFTKDAFRFFRGYVDYYYLLTKANKTNLPTLAAHWNTEAWCVGDPHPENFGFIILKNGASVFTVNDIDDSGPCPAVTDLFRFLVSTRLHDSKTKLDPLVDAYLAGVQLQNFKMPGAIEKMKTKSQNKGTAPRPSKVSGNSLVREELTTEVTAAQREQIKQSLKYLASSIPSTTKVVDITSTSKVSGGSSGMLRYEVLLDNKGELTHLELKEQGPPAIYSVAPTTVPPTAERIMTSLKNDQGPNFSFYYNVVELNGKSMFVRPRFDGNVGVSLSKDSDSKNNDILAYEAYTLGILHARTIQNVPTWAKALSTYPMKNWEADVAAMTKHFETKFSQLK